MLRKILLVDDDVDDQVIFIDALSEITTQVECITVNNGLEALATLRMLMPLPSLIFLDLNMPLMNGFQCLEQIKKDNQYKKIPVVIFTTSNNPVDATMAKKSGADLFLTKTPDFRLLQTKLLDILKANFSNLST